MAQNPVYRHSSLAVIVTPFAVNGDDGSPVATGEAAAR
jgi:hypothetical protein